MSPSRHPAEGEDFVREMVRRDLENGKYPSVVTRFPPEPNGYLHIGHAKSICLNFGLAEEFAGRCHLRYDDTNPQTEDPEYVAAIQRDVAWLGFDWGEHLYFASDYFERLYAWAEQLVRGGLAYVDSSSEAEIRHRRGTISEPGTPSPDRDRPIEESLELLRQMRRGEHEEGAHVLRAKIDMAADNMLMRDPLLYRIRKTPHYRQGDAWSIYPMYDYAHCLEDAIENITHSLCTLEFENNRELYDWVLNAVGIERPRTEQTEFARLNLGYTVMSKRKLLRLVQEGHVDGWDDPRMPTLSGLRRRGVTPEAIRRFCDDIGVAKSHNVIDVARLEHAVRDDLNHRAPRALGVLDPLPLELIDWPADRVEWLDAPSWPHDVPREGSRPLPLARQLIIERDDFSDDPPPDWHRLAPDRSVRLRHGVVVHCVEVVKDVAGRVVSLRCTHEPRGVERPADAPKIHGTIHWLSAEHSVSADVRLYDRLFTVEQPDAVDPETGESDFLGHLNPTSLEVRTAARLEPSLADAAAGEHVQLERQGYFVVDASSTPERPVLNRTVTLRDTWAKIANLPEAHEAAERARRNAAEKAAFKAEQRRASAETGEVADLDPERQEIAQRFEALGLQTQDARLLALDPALAQFFEGALQAHDAPKAVANWLLNELRGLLETRPIGDLPFAPPALGELVALVDGGEITAAAGKTVLAEMVETGSPPREVVARRGLARLADDEALVPHVEAVLASHPQQVEAYRGGKTALLGFFVGQIMQRTRGQADPQSVRALLTKRL
ncbi:MAG: glutamine--tRNA ligase/YqeY domain fusion protein [Acidobacteriota bacterium]